MIDEDEKRRSRYVVRGVLKLIAELHFLSDTRVNCLELS